MASELSELEINKVGKACFNFEQRIHSSEYQLVEPTKHVVQQSSDIKY